jgi:hypothetical protein
MPPLENASGQALGLQAEEGDLQPLGAGVPAQKVLDFPLDVAIKQKICELFIEFPGCYRGREETSEEVALESHNEQARGHAISLAVPQPPPKDAQELPEHRRHHSAPAEGGELHLAFPGGNSERDDPQEPVKGRE